MKIIMKSIKRERSQIMWKQWKWKAMNNEKREIIRNNENPVNKLKAMKYENISNENESNERKW